MGMDLGNQIVIPKTKKDLHRGTDPPAFRSSEVVHSRNWHQWIHDYGHPEPVRCIRCPQAGQLLLLEVLSSWTELWHLWLGTISHHGNTRTAMALPPRCLLQGLKSVRLQQSRILPDIQNTLQKTCQVVRNSFTLQLRHSTPGRHHEPCWWPV